MADFEILLEEGTIYEKDGFWIIELDADRRISVDSEVFDLVLLEDRVGIVRK